MRNNKQTTGTPTNNLPLLRRSHIRRPTYSEQRQCCNEASSQMMKSMERRNMPCADWLETPKDVSPSTSGGAYLELRVSSLVIRQEQRCYSQGCKSQTLFARMSFTYRGSCVSPVPPGLRRKDRGCLFRIIRIRSNNIRIPAQV